MPGVPSSRGCEACRKQKKKCDQLKPSCSRCSRLKIACIGGGLQRFKFIQDERIPERSTPVQTAQTQVSGAISLLPPASPGNQVTILTSAFISALAVTDVRYDLACYGGFLNQIPARLGKNPALDASVGAITAAFPSLYTQQLPPDAISRYIDALRALRICLQDPATANSVDTLCAIYLILVCQAWIGKDDDHYITHGEVMAYILNALLARDLQGTFESQLLVTMSVPVILEGMFNPKIQLGPWFSKLTAYGPERPLNSDEHTPIESLKLENLGKFPAFVQHPELHIREIKSSYQRILGEFPKVQQGLAKVTAEPAPFGLPPDMASRLISRYQTAYSMMLSMALALNAILRAFDPFNISLGEASVGFADESISLGHQASHHRPLGSSAIPMCLVAAWATSPDTSRRPEIERMLAEYKLGITEPKWMMAAVWTEICFERMRNEHSISSVQEFLDNARLSREESETIKAADIQRGGSCCIL